MGGRAAAWPPCGGIVFHIDMLSGIVGWEERNGILHRGPSPAHHHLRPVTGLCGQAFNCWAFREDINHVNAMKTTMSSPVIHSEPYLTRAFISICYTQTRVDIDAWKVRLDSWLYRVRVRRLRVYGGIFCPCWVSQQVEVYVSKDNLNSWCFEAKTIWFLKYCPNMVLSNRPFVYLPVLCTITEYFFGLGRSKHAINWNTVMSQLCRNTGTCSVCFSSTQTTVKTTGQCSVSFTFFYLTGGHLIQTQTIFRIIQTVFKLTLSDILLDNMSIKLRIK